MMICEKCGTDISEEMKFCGQCGAKVNKTIHDVPVKETSDTDATLPVQADSGSSISCANREDETINKHEKATQASILSFIGLFSIHGRRRRLPMLVAGLVSGMVGIVPIIGFFLSIWIGIANVFKRLHDLDQPDHVGICLVVLNVVSWLALLNADGSLLFVCSFIGLIVGMYLLFWPGSSGANTYGRSPEELKQIDK